MGDCRNYFHHHPVFGIRSIVREGREPEIKKDDELSKEKFYRYCEEETRKIKEFKAKFEKEWYGESIMQDDV